MKVYQNVQSTVKPEAVTMDDESVWVNTDIKEVLYTDPETGFERTEYEYTMTQYTKDEFILKQMDEITDTQLALCELYEKLIG